jgi:hypothetical protein
MSDRIVALERAEIDAFTDLYRAASPDVVEGAGLAASTLGDIVVLAASRIVLALNRALALGLNAPLSDRLVADLLSELAERRWPRFFIPVAPVNEHARSRDRPSDVRDGGTISRTRAKSRSRRRRCMCLARPPGSDSPRPTPRTESVAPSARSSYVDCSMPPHLAARG